MSEVEASVGERRRISAIWLVPIVALALGGWMVIHTLRSRGPEITIVFDSGEGIEADKTKIKVRSVEVGLVDGVGLAEDLEGVVVTARLEKAAEPLLREDTQFWVVRPRVGPGGVSGIGTLLSGGFIQLAPGTGEAGRREFQGLEAPPVTPAGTPGLHLQLVGEHAGSVGGGDPILYEGFRVGRIESATFDVESRKMLYRAFIEAPYDDLVTSASRFWNASGLAVSATADGIQVQTASLETLLVGGVTFGLPEGMDPGGKPEPGEVFTLYPDYASVNEQPYRFHLDYVVRFPQSIRGLRPGAPVEYRGIPIGRVERVLLSELAAEGFRGDGQPIPVLIRVEPGRLALPDSAEGNAILARAIEEGVARGLRGSLATGNLLTGNLFVSFDPVPDAAPAPMGSFAGRPTLPTVGSGLEAIQVRLSALLDKLNALPLDDVLEGVDRLLADVGALVAREDLQSLPGSLETTLADLQETLRSVSGSSALQERLMRTMTELDRTLETLRAVLETLEEQPSALIFDREPAEDPEPPAGTP